MIAVGAPRDLDLALYGKRRQKTATLPGNLSRTPPEGSCDSREWRISSGVPTRVREVIAYIETTSDYFPPKVHRLEGRGGFSGDLLILNGGPVVKNECAVAGKHVCPASYLSQNTVTLSDIRCPLGFGPMSHEPMGSLCFLAKSRLPVYLIPLLPRKPMKSYTKRKYGVRFPGL